MGFLCCLVPRGVVETRQIGLEILVHARIAPTDASNKLMRSVKIRHGIEEETTTKGVTYLNVARLNGVGIKGKVDFFDFGTCCTAASVARD